MRLNGEQRKSFHRSLLSAFPSISRLRRMVSFELDENLDAIAMGENHSEIVFELIRWAETEGKVRHLLNAARSSNSGNLELRSFEEEMRDKFDENPKSVIPENVYSPKHDYAGERNYFSTTTINPKIEEDDLSSEEGFDYKRLQNLLKVRRWEEADRETLKVMLAATCREEAGWLDTESIEKFPCIDLLTIDRLWVKYSKGRFGFSVQKRIWERVAGKPDADDEIWREFYYRVGWRVNDDWINFSEVKFQTQPSRGNLPQTTLLRKKKTNEIVTEFGSFGGLLRNERFYELRFDNSRLGCQAIFSRLDSCKA